MKKHLFIITCACILTGWLSSCGVKTKGYNEGIHIIPAPQSINQREGSFELTKQSTFYTEDTVCKKASQYFIDKIKRSTGYELEFTNDSLAVGSIQLKLDASLLIDPEGYALTVSPNTIVIKAKTQKGIFYGLQTVMQLLPAEIESANVVKGVKWEVPCVNITDAPRFAYRGVHLDPCRHFITVENVKKQLDVMAMLKINHMHWHLTEDQGWRIEIKKYPKLTGVGASRIEGEGYEYKGYYTQEEVKEIVAYAAERQITIVPELELPGHELAAIAAYPELSCTGEATTPRIVWGVENLVMCPGKEDMFIFLENVIKEMVTLFPGTYFHIGGDECPKKNWEKCAKCQARIRKEHLKADKHHTAEQRLQSYVIKRMENVLAKYGKKIIGWDEILEGGLSENATVMSWRGEKGGIAAATQSHDVIMTPGSKGLYFDHYQGDPKLEPVAIGGYSTLQKVYSYNPVPDTLVTMHKAHHIIGVQCNNWSEYLYTNEQMEYQLYPRVAALAEIAWTSLDRKDYADFARRINHFYVRLDGHNIHYHIPQPEQPNGSCNLVVFTDSLSMPFQTSRPIKVVYTTDGSAPTPKSTTYTGPLKFTESTILKIRSVLPSGKMSPTRVIKIEKQALQPASIVQTKTPGLQMQMVRGKFMCAKELEGVRDWTTKTISSLVELRSQQVEPDAKGERFYAAVATGYVDIPEDGVYYFSSNNDEVWIDGKLIVNNAGEVKRSSRKDASVALAKGLHPIKVVFCKHIIGGVPSHWDSAAVKLRKADDKKFVSITPEQLYY